MVRLRKRARCACTCTSVHAVRENAHVHLKVRQNKPYLQANPDSEIIHYKEGKVANVVVYDFEAGYKDLHLNGIEEASSRVWHVQLFKLLGVLPMMSHPDPDEALMIAFGAGMSAGASIEHASSLTVVDLNPDIYGPAEAFTRENLDVINNPKLKLVENDGRNGGLVRADLNSDLGANFVFNFH